MVEVPLLVKQYDEQKEKDRELHEEFEEERVSRTTPTGQTHCTHHDHVTSTCMGRVLWFV